MADDTDTDDRDERRKRRREWVVALTKSMAETMPQTRGQSIRSGAEIDGQIAALEARCAALEAVDIATDKRLDVLEAGGTNPIPPEPIDPPPSGGKRYPDVNDPGCGVPPGTTLTTQGGMSITTAGQKISGKKFTGRVTVKAANVEIFNCEFNIGDDWWALDMQASGCNVHHCSFISKSTIGNTAINTTHGARIAYCRFRGWENSLNAYNSNGVLIEWNDGDGLIGPSSAHYDVLQGGGGCDGLEIRNNRFNCGYGWTSAIMIDNYFGPIRNVTIHDNYLSGGGYTCYLDASFKGAANATNVKYLNNVIKPGQWGYFFWRDPGTGCEHKGNVDATTGANVDGGG